MSSTPNGKDHAGQARPAPEAPQEIPVVLVERRFDAVELTAVVNDPSVYPWVRASQTGPLDLTDLAADPRNVLLSGEFGSMIFMPMAPGLWELHTQVLPEGRGAWTLGLGASAFGWLFTHTDAVEILTRVPQGNLAAAAIVRKIGATQEWSQSDGWTFEDKQVGISVWAVSLQVWLRSRYAAPLEDIAAEFLGVLAPGEAVRPDALRPLGFCLAAIRGKQAAKGCVFLNRWGAIAGFPPAFVAAENPLTVNLGGAFFRVSDDGEIIDMATSH